MTKPQDPKTTFKALLLDYDYLLTKSDDECCFSFSEREVQIMLAFVVYVGWKTRYKQTETEIDTDIIQGWSGELAKKLMSGCCPDGKLSRFTEDGVFQTSDDGGVTWEDNPEEDPRNDYVSAPPLPGEDSEAKRCAAADNVRDLFKSYRDQLVDMLTAGAPLISIVSGILAFIGVITGVSGVAVGISVLIMGLAAFLITLTPSEVTDQITDEVLDTFRCLVFCRMENSGQITYDNWVLLLSDIAGEFTGFPETFFYQTVNGMGYIGISNAGTIGVATADDCGDCGCDDTCPVRYDVKEPYSSPLYGTVIARGADYVDLEIGTSGFGVIGSADYNVCCRVAAIASVVGSPTAGSHIPCGLPYSEGNYVFSSGLTACCSFLLATGATGDVIRYYFTDDC